MFLCLMFCLKAAPIIRVSCADRRIQRKIPGPPVPDFGYNSGDDCGMDCFHGDWPGDDSDSEVVDSFGTALVDVPRKVKFHHLFIPRL